MLKPGKDGEQKTRTYKHGLFVGFITAINSLDLDTFEANCFKSEWEDEWVHCALPSNRLRHGMKL